MAAGQKHSELAREALQVAAGGVGGFLAVRREGTSAAVVRYHHESREVSVAAVEGDVIVIVPGALDLSAVAAVLRRMAETLERRN